MQPTLTQKTEFNIEGIHDIFPKYYVLKVNNFNDIAKDTLDEWIYFLKNSEVQEGFKAKGLQEAMEKLKEESLSEDEKFGYKRFQENRRIERSVLETAYIEGEEKGMNRERILQDQKRKEEIELLEQKRKEEIQASIAKLKAIGMTKTQIAEILGIAENEV